jgi:DNA-binding transcriptional MerR regulator
VAGVRPGDGKMMKEDVDGQGRVGRPGRGLRMKELTAATGLPKSAILHYVAQGLLPEPAKTSRNMAYYDPECVERIQFIKSLQAGYSLPLSKIRLLLKSRDEGRDITPLIELNEVVFAGNEEPTLDMMSFCAATGLEPCQVKSLLEAGLLVPLESERFNRYDVNIGSLYAGSFERGLTVSDLAFYAESAKRIIDEEMALRKRLTAHLPEEQDARVTAQLVRAARAVRNYVIDRSFQRRVTSMAHLREEDSEG